MSTGLVEFRPGDTLNIVWTSVQDTPLGPRQLESNFQFTYDELLSRLRAKGKAGKSRRSGTDGARFSRVVALAVNAMKKGKWSTGADIDREEVFAKLISKFGKLNLSEYENITLNARVSLKALVEHKSILSAPQKVLLHGMLAAIERHASVPADDELADS